MDLLGVGLWRWTTTHPLWRSDMAGPGGWGQDVASFAFRGPNGIALIDPLVDDWSPVDALVAEQAVAVVLTAPWHARSSAEVAARYDATVFVHEQAGGLVTGIATVPMRDGEIVDGMEVLPVAGVDEGEVALWIPTERALITAEVLMGTERGLRVAESPALRSRDELRAWLSHLAELPIDLVLPSHGPPVRARGQHEIQAALNSSAAASRGVPLTRDTDCPA